VNKFSRTLQLTLAFVGGGLGVGIAFWAIPRASSDTPTHERAVPNLTDAKRLNLAKDDDTDAQQRLIRLERRFAELEQRASVPPSLQASPGASAEQVPASDLRRLDEGPDATAQRELETWTRRIDEFESDPLDAEWAHATSRALEEGLESAIGTNGGIVERVECRSSQCKAVLGWANEQGLQSGSVSAVQASYSINCAQHIKLSADPASLRSTMIFDCRDEGSQPE
jgi:hypothetical protein